MQVVIVIVIVVSNYYAENIYNDEEPETPAELKLPPAANNKAST